MNKPLPVVMTLGLALLAGAVSAADDRPIDQRRPLKADARVAVSNVAGLIEVEAWDKNELHLTGTMADEVEKIEITGSDSSLKIEVKLPERTRNVGDTVLKLKIPAGASLDAEAVSADIRAKGLRGAVSAESVSGDIDLDVGSKRVKAQTVSGDVTLQAPSEDTRIESVSGNVTLRGGKGEVRGESVSGNLQVQARELRMLDLETVSGDMELDLEFTRDAEIEVETLSGDVRVTVSQLPDMDIELETYSGELESGLLPGLRKQKEFDRDGEGKGRLRLHSFSGDVILKKK